MSVSHLSHVEVPRLFWRGGSEKSVDINPRVTMNPTLSLFLDSGSVILMSEVGRGSGSGAGLALDIDSRKVGRLVGPHCPPPIGHSVALYRCDWSQCCNRSTWLAECM